MSSIIWAKPLAILLLLSMLILSYRHSNLTKLPRQNELFLYSIGLVFLQVILYIFF